jgi:hypothetical protein
MLLVCWACAAQTASDPSPGPSPSPPSSTEGISGVWRGTYRIETCRRVSGSGSSYCRFVLGAAVPFELRATQTGQAVTGRLSFFSTGGTLLLTGEASGVVEASGEIRLTAVVRSVPGAEGEETTRIDGWRSRVSSDGVMSGEFTRHRSFTNAFGPQVSDEGCRIVSAARTGA